MRKSSIALLAALATATGLALAYGTGDSSSTASTSPPPAQSGQQDMQDMQGNMDFAGGPGAVDTSQPLPPNHPPINAGANGATPPSSPQDNVHGFPAGGGSDEQEPAALVWKAPAAWSPAPNPNPMRLATYKLPHAGSDKDDTELVVSRAGGDVGANISRWAGQFEGAGTPKETKKTIHDLKVTIVNIEGKYQGGMGPSSGPHEGWALLGAIVETKGQPYFFKVIGPAATVRGAQKPFEAMIDGVTPN